jgi:hypothetical protein
MVGKVSSCRNSEGGNPGLHVGSPASVEQAVADFRAERIRGPVCRVTHGHDIGMSGEAEVRRLCPKPRIEVIDPLERVALGSEAQRVEDASQYVLGPVMAGVHRWLADQGLGQGEGVAHNITHGHGFSPCGGGGGRPAPQRLDRAALPTMVAGR